MKTVNEALIGSRHSRITWWRLSRSMTPPSGRNCVPAQFGMLKQAGAVEAVPDMNTLNRLLIGNLQRRIERWFYFSSTTPSTDRNCVQPFVNVKEESNVEMVTDVRNLSNPFIGVRRAIGMRLLFESIFRVYLLLVLILIHISTTG
jgi:hypothetical protein